MKRTALIIGLTMVCANLWASEPIKPKGITGESKALFLASREANINFIYPVWGYYLNVSPGFSNISSDVAEYWNKPAGGLGYALDLGYFRSLSPFFRISAGVGLSSVKSTLELKPEGDKFDYVAEDIDGDLYTEEIIINENVKEITQPMYVSVPLMFEFGNLNIDKLGFYVNVGVRFSYLISNGYKYEGNYSAKGYYDKYQVTLENIPELGFYNDHKPDKSGSLKDLNTALQGGAGISIPLSSAMIFKAGVITHWGLSDIGSPKTTSSEGIENDPNHPRYHYFSENNSLTTNENALTRHFGIEFGLYINRLLK